MPVRKKQRVEVVRDDDEDPQVALQQHRVMCQMVDEFGKPVGTQVLLPVTANVQQLDQLLCSLLESDEDKELPYAFFIGGEQLNGNVADILRKHQEDAFVAKQISEGRRVRPKDIEALPFEVPEETTVNIVFKPQAVFRVRPVTRCSATLDGHSEAVLIVCFSPDSCILATGGGDKEVRLWDIHTLTPTDVLKGHNGWVQVLSWSPDGAYLVSGSRDGALLCWSHGEDYTNFKSKSFRAHSDYVTQVSWEPLHRNESCCRFVSASKDTTLKVWHAQLGLQQTLSAHQACVTCVKWGGEGRIYSSSQDKTIIVWSAEDGAPLSTLRGHAHWVNFIALNTDVVLRTGAFDHEERKFATKAESKEYALKRYQAVISRAGCTGERLVSGSDDNTLFLWNPEQATKPIAQLTGHQGVVFHVQFSPDGSLMASCGADKSVKLWNAADGKFVTTFRGHVAPVYHIAWSSDSRMLISASRDSTLKLWSVAKKNMVEDLSGHSDEIFSVDWSPDGTRVASGSKDKKVRIWVH